MIEQETDTALIEAIEKLDAAMQTVSGLRGILKPDVTNYASTDIAAVRSALAVVYENVQHASALLHSILDKGR